MDTLTTADVFLFADFKRHPELHRWRHRKLHHPDGSLGSDGGRARSLRRSAAPDRRSMHGA